MQQAQKLLATIKGHNLEVLYIRFHDLRHSAATLLMSMGIHAKVVQELLGHNRIQEMVDTYNQVLPTIHREAIKKLEDVLWKELS